MITFGLTKKNISSCTISAFPITFLVFEYSLMHYFSSCCLNS